MAKWSVVPGILVHGFAWGGAPAVGVVSLGLLVPLLLGAALVNAAQARYTTHTTRVGAFAVQTVCYAAAATAAVLGAPTPIVAPLVITGLCAFMLVAPTTAALLPQLARSADEMVRANLWVTYSDSASGLIGSLTAGLVLGFGGPTAVFVAGAGAAGLGLAATVWRASAYVRSIRAGSIAESKGVLRRTTVEFWSHAWGQAVIFLWTARNIVFGAFDVMLVIIALEVLDMGESGPGYLSAMVGAGALASTFVTSPIVHRQWLRPALMLAITVTALATLTVGAQLERPVVFVALPVMGLTLALIDALGRALLIRSTDPRTLSALYGSLSLVGGLGQVVGSVVVQVVLAVSDARLAVIALGGLLAFLSGMSVRALRKADEHVEIPVVEMALLAGQPMMSALPTDALERVARGVDEQVVLEGDAIMTSGETVDACYVVMEGEFSVLVRDRVIGALDRGEVIGEVALLTGMDSNKSVVAVSDSRVLRIERRSFLFALTGYDLHEMTDTPDLAEARGRYRDVVAAHEGANGGPVSDRPDLWLGLSAAGRMLGDASYTDALARTAEVAQATSNDVALAEAAALATWPGAFFFIADNPDEEMIGLCEKALAVLDRSDPMRVRVLATLASNLAFAAPIERRRQLIAEAHELAEEHERQSPRRRSAEQ